VIDTNKLKSLKNLLDEGILSAQEFEVEKKKVLEAADAPSETTATDDLSMDLVDETFKQLEMDRLRKESEYWEQLAQSKESHAKELVGQTKDLTSFGAFLTYALIQKGVWEAYISGVLRGTFTIESMEWAQLIWPITQLVNVMFILAIIFAVQALIHNVKLLEQSMKSD